MGLAETERVHGADARHFPVMPSIVDNLGRMPLDIIAVCNPSVLHYEFRRTII